MINFDGLFDVINVIAAILFQVLVGKDSSFQFHAHLIDMIEHLNKPVINIITYTTMNTVPDLLRNNP